jgi:hypothetical protein
MRELLCMHQQTMLATNLGVHVSVCHKAGCEYFCNTIHKDVCESCPDRVPVPNPDEIRESLSESVYAEIECRPVEEVDDLMEVHCKRCESYRQRSGVCSHTSCQHHVPIRDMMENPKTHCVKGVW